MTRMAAGRSTHLSVDEIVATALALFDESTVEFSMRTLAARLRVTPAAIYHHFERQSDLIYAVVSKVWDEVITEYLTLVEHPFGEGDPVATLVAGGVATRRVFDRHPRVAPHIAVRLAPGNPRTAGALAVFGSMFEQLGLEGEAAGNALYAYATYVLGSVLLSAHRRINDQDPDRRSFPPDFSSVPDRPPDAPVISPQTSAALDRIATIAHSESEEAVFVGGLRGLLRGLTQPDGTLAISATH